MGKPASLVKAGLSNVFLLFTIISLISGHYSGRLNYLSTYVE
jgi:hypothetical protein